ncbi:MAG: hypothetical protein AB4290_18315, partial [Spirulina sp.]
NPKLFNLKSKRKKNPIASKLKSKRKNPKLFNLKSKRRKNPIISKLKSKRKNPKLFNLKPKDSPTLPLTSSRRFNAARDRVRLYPSVRAASWNRVFKPISAG